MNFDKKSQIKNILRLYRTKPTSYWQREQKNTALRIFKTASRHASSYKTFLRQQGINPAKVKNFTDFTALPTISKANYFWKFSPSEVALQNHYQNKGMVMTATSGSTGLPTYFPRTEQIDWQYSVLAEYFLQNGENAPTLLIDCFGMGVWIGGLITYQAFRMVALRGYPVTVITPGINKKEIFHALRELAPHFENVILAGYPPFIKDILDEAEAEKINFNKFRVRLLFAAESFTEQFRDYVCGVTKIKNPFLDTLNIYGSAELGAMAFETPGSIFIRRLALKNEKIFHTLFPRGGIPTLAQYNPAFVFFEAQEGKILISANGPVPFVRYDIGDTGGVYDLETITAIFKEHGINLTAQAELNRVPLMHLPFVYIHVRSDFATKLYGAIVHPQPIQEALQQKIFKKLLTGKFTMTTKTNKTHSQFLEINLELKPKVTPAGRISTKAKKEILEFLLRKNAEYKNNFQSIPKKVAPVVKLWPYESPEYFRPGIKQKWVTK